MLPAPRTGLREFETSVPVQPPVECLGVSGGGAREMLGENFVGGWNATELGLKRVNERVQIEVRDSLLRERDQGVVSLALSGHQLTDAGLAPLLAWGDSISLLNAGNGPLTDEGMKVIGQLPRLGVLDLSGTRVTDAGVERLAGKPTLYQLALPGTGVTDAGLTQLPAFVGLRQLFLRGCRHITDEGLAHLRPLTGLHSLELTDCPGLTAEGIAALREALPACKIVS